jgi:hypothetical protein
MLLVSLLEIRLRSAQQVKPLLLVHVDMIASAGLLGVSDDRLPEDSPGLTSSQRHDPDLERKPSGTMLNCRKE